MKSKLTPILVVIAGVTALLGLFTLPSRSPFELKLFSSKPLGMTNGKEFIQVTLQFINRDKSGLWFTTEEIQAKVGGRWIAVFSDLGGGAVVGGGKLQKRLILPAEADAIRLEFSYQFYNYRPTWMAVFLSHSGGLGRMAERLVHKIPFLGRLVWPQPPQYMRSGDITIEVEIPPRASKPN